MAETNLSRRSFLTLLASVPVWLTLPSGLVRAATLTVSRVRYWSAPDHTRIVFELDAQARFESRMYHDPERVALEIRGVEVREPIDQSVGDGLVRSIHVGPSAGAAIRMKIKEKPHSDERKRSRPRSAALMAGPNRGRHRPAPRPAR